MYKQEMMYEFIFFGFFIIWRRYSIYVCSIYNGSLFFVIQQFPTIRVIEEIII